MKSGIWIFNKKQHEHLCSSTFEATEKTFARKEGDQCAGKKMQLKCHMSPRHHFSPEDCSRAPGLRNSQCKAQNEVKVFLREFLKAPVLALYSFLLFASRTLYSFLSLLYAARYLKLFDGIFYLRLHAYADDAQLYLSFRVNSIDDQFSTVAAMEHCISDSLGCIMIS